MRRLANVPRTSSIAGRLARATLTTMVCFLVLATGATVFNLRRFTVRTVSDFSRTILHETETKIDTFILEMESLALSLARTRIVREIDEPDLKDLFVAAVEARSRFVRAIYVGTVDGSMHEYGAGAGFVNFEPDLPSDYDPRVRPWYRSAIDADGFVISEPYVYASQPVLGVTAAYPVRAYDGALVGVLGIDLMLDSLRDLLFDLEIPKDGRAILVADDGSVIASQYESLRERDVRLATFDAGLLNRIRGAPDGGFTSEFEGERTVFSYTSIPSADWVLLLGLPYRSIVADVDQVLRVLLISTVALGVIAFAVQLAAANRLVVAPVAQLMNVVERLHRGERDARSALSGEDEFAVLADELNTLAQAVQDYSDDMEERVQRRTRALLELEEENIRLRLSEERERIMHDLHDTLGARLTNISICTSVALAQPDSLPETAGRMLDRIDANCREAMDGIRSVVLGGTPIAGGMDLVDYLDRRVRWRLSLREIDLEAEIGSADSVRALSQPDKDLIRFVVDELVTNVLKHAEATRVVLNLTITPDRFELVVADDGRGIETVRQPMAGFGVGLESVTARVEALQGTFHVESTGNGTRASVVVPRGAASGGHDGHRDR